MHRTTLTLPLLLLVVLLLASVAGAAPAAAQTTSPWSPPQATGVEQPRNPQLAFNRTGSLGVGSLGFGAAATRVLGLRAGGQPVAAARDVGSVEDGPLPYATTRTLSLRRTATNIAGTFRLGYSFGRSDTLEVGTTHALRTVALRPGEAELAVSPNGNAVIAFAEERGGATRVFLSTRRASSSRFSTPRVVRGGGSARSLAVSVNDRGRWVLAYVFGAGRTRTVEARIGTVSGAVGSLQTIGRQLGIARLDAIVAPTGRTTVAWATHDGGEEQNEPTELRTNVASAGRTRFAGQVVLDRAAPGAVATEQAPPSLAASPDGTTLVGYTLSGRFVGTGIAGDANSITPARVSVQDADARFTAPQELAADGVVGRVAARADGTFAVPYVQGAALEPTAAPLFVALGRATFTAERVADDALLESAVAFEPGTEGAPVVLYTRLVGAAMSRRGG
jgi:hypothetical protein